MKGMQIFMTHSLFNSGYEFIYMLETIEVYEI